MCVPMWVVIVVSEMTKAMAFLNKELKTLTAKECQTIANDVFEVSQRNVPVDTGTLKGSGYIDKIDANSYTIGYSAEYAEHVHDDLSKYHQNGEAMFLANAVSEILSERGSEL